MTSWRQYAARFVVPALLLAGAVAAWLVGSQLGRVERPNAAPIRTEALDTPMTSIRRLPEVATASRQSSVEAAALDRLPPDPGGLSCAVVLVDGEPLLAVRPELVNTAVYAQMAIAAHTAIDLLGPGYTFDTRILADDQPDLNGRLFFGLYLVGGGDPVFTTYLHSRSFRPLRTTRTAIEDLASAVAEAGVVRVDGGIVTVDDRYDLERTLPGWPQDLVDLGDLSPLGALQVDDGLEARAATNGGVAIAAADPGVHAGEVLAELLDEAGVQVFGPVRALGPDDELPALIPIARLTSPPLSEITTQMLAVNDATGIEMLVKEIGFAESGEGTTAAGAAAIQRMMGQLGVDLVVPYRDGSGLDPNGSANCNELAFALDAIGPDHPTLDVLPSYRLPGVFGGQLGDIDLRSDLRLVGGTQGDASAFVARTVDQGRRVTVVSIVNRPGGASSSDLDYQRALVELVDDLRQSVSVEEVAAN